MTLDTSALVSHSGGGSDKEHCVQDRALWINRTSWWPAYLVSPQYTYLIYLPKGHFVPVMSLEDTSRSTPKHSDVYTRLLPVKIWDMGDIPHD